ncbi:MAG: Trehalose synthase [Methanocella sp. PtaU1.Bin125]|nr:MAG: Trehalose synthase [Methanocella sp. PtaU1.Bin125]
MKVAIVVPYFARYVRGNEYGLADGLARLGADVTVIASQGKALREKMLTSESKPADEAAFKVRYLPTLLDVGEIPFTPAVIGEVRRGGYDALLLQEDYQLICHMAYLAAKRKGTPTVLSTERTHFPSGFRRPALWLFDHTLNAMLRRGATAYTAHCTAARDFVRRELGVPDGRVRVLHVGVDAGLFRPVQGQTPLTDGEIKLLTVARLHPYKGLEHLIRAMAIVHRRHPGVVLYVMGRGPSGPDLKKLAGDLTLDDAVRFVETPVPNTQMPPVYSSCDVYLQPSVVEPYGIAVLEAMACGRPVICSRVGGMMDTVEDGVTGFLVPPADPEALAEKILALAGDDRRRAALGAASRERVERLFDWPVIARQYLSLIESLSEARR